MHVRARARLQMEVTDVVALQQEYSHRQRNLIK